MVHFVLFTLLKQCNTPEVGGFTIELPNFNMILNVQDINSNLIADADVTIDCLGDIITGKTDNNGCFPAIILPEVVCDLTIVKNNYQIYNSGIILLPLSGLNDPAKNFVIKVRDASNNDIFDATVDIQVNGVSTNSGTTDPNGIFEGDIDTAAVNTLSVTSTGPSLSFTHEFDPFVKFNCGTTDFRVVPIIVLT